jgi:hypothetical protein
MQRKKDVQQTRHIHRLGMVPRSSCPIPIHTQQLSQDADSMSWSLRRARRYRRIEEAGKSLGYIEGRKCFRALWVNTAYGVRTKRAGFPFLVETPVMMSAIVHHSGLYWNGRVLDGAAPDRE